MTESTETSGATRVVGRMPDFFIVGHPKCGTTALYEMLRRHPQIYMPDFKEPWFFADDMRPRFQPARSGLVPATLDSYLSLFAPAGVDQRVGEASSSYLRSRNAAGRIGQLRPDARIIAILREPADFLRSLHHQMLSDHVETKKDLRRAIALERARREGRKIPRRSHLPQMLLYSDHVRYVEQLSRYRDAFPARQLLILVYDDFRADNEATLRRVRRFLEVREEVPLEVFDVNTSNKRMRSQQLDDLVNIVSVGRGPLSGAVKTAVKALTSSGVRETAMRLTRHNLVYGKPQPADAGLMLELRRRFRGEVVALSDYLERDLLGLWGYDRLD
jgi:Sulfotransferase domain